MSWTSMSVMVAMATARLNPDAGLLGRSTLHRTTLVLTTISVVAATFGIACVILIGLRRRLRAIDLVLSILPAAVVLGAGLAVLAGRLNYFGVIHLAYLAVTVTVPGIAAVGAAVAVMRRATK